MKRSSDSGGWTLRGSASPLCAELICDIIRRKIGRAERLSWVDSDSDYSELDFSESLELRRVRLRSALKFIPDKLSLLPTRALFPHFPLPVCAANMVRENS